MPSASAITSVTLLLVAIANAVTLNCEDIVVNKKKYDLSKIGGPHSVTTSDLEGPPSIRNTTWTVDLCKSLVVDKKIPLADQCKGGTRVCGIETSWNPEDDPDQKGIIINKVIPIAGLIGDFQNFNPKPRPINDDDDKHLGLVIDMYGPEYEGEKQKASIELRCDGKRTGNEGQAKEENLRARDDKDDTAKDEPSLTFVSYTDDEKESKTKTLKLLWKTKYVCADAEGDSDDTTKKASWGFFTWFILIAFLGIAAYLIFGSWLNYNRYGARGWDLLPHGDTIRDVPYIFKDFSRKVLDTFSGSGSRGGYSAV